MKFFIWTNRYSYLAVAHADSVAKAREALRDEIGESGDGSCPERDKARAEIAATQPAIYMGPTAEFVLTDSAEQREFAANYDKDQHTICELKDRMARMSNALAGVLAHLDGEAPREDAMRTLKGAMDDFQRADEWLRQRDAELGRRARRMQEALKFAHAELRADADGWGYVLLRIERLAEMPALSANGVTAREPSPASGGETYTDGKGTVWERPTAYAYARACHALEAAKGTIAELERRLA